MQPKKSTTDNSYLTVHHLCRDIVIIRNNEWYLRRIKKPGSGTKRFPMLGMRRRSCLRIGHVNHGRSIRTVNSLRWKWFYRLKNVNGKKWPMISMVKESRTNIKKL